MEIIFLSTEQREWSEVEPYLQRLSPERRRSVLKKNVGSDRVNALLSRLLLMSELEKRLGVPEKRITFLFGAYGKPYIKDNPVFFSLSHTKGAAAVVFSEDGEAGVDVELRERRVNPGLYVRALSPAERGRVTTDEEFMRLWVQKEAFLKRIGVGITRDLRGLDAGQLPDTAAMEHGRYLIGVSGKGALETAVSEITLSDLLAVYD